MRIIYLAMVIVTFPAIAGWRIGEQAIDISACTTGHCFISTSCLNNKVPKCQALQASEKRKKSEIGPGGTNPGSVICTRHHKGGVVILMDDKGGTTGFCRFPDGSYLSLDGLWHW